MCQLAALYTAWHWHIGILAYWQIIHIHVEMKKINKKHFPEQVIYLVIWLIVFLVPIVGDYYAASGTKTTFNWNSIRVAWLIMLPFLLLFVANNYLLAPYLLFRKKYLAYALSVLAIVILLFGVYPYFYHPPYGNRIM